MAYPLGCSGGEGDNLYRRPPHKNRCAFIYFFNGNGDLFAWLFELFRHVHGSPFPPFVVNDSPAAGAEVLISNFSVDGFCFHQISYFEFLTRPSKASYRFPIKSVCFRMVCFNSFTSVRNRFWMLFGEGKNGLIFARTYQTSRTSPMGKA